MNRDKFIEYLKTLPENTEIVLQTCEGDLCTPLNMNHMSVSFISNENTFHSSMLILTAFIKGRDSYDYENDRRGFFVIDKSELKGESATGSKEQSND